MNALTEPMSIPKKYKAIPEHTGSHYHFLDRTDGKQTQKVKRMPKRVVYDSRRARDRRQFNEDIYQMSLLCFRRLTEHKK